MSLVILNKLDGILSGILNGKKIRKKVSKSSKINTTPESKEFCLEKLFLKSLALSLDWVGTRNFVKFPVF